jgi:poly(3-hydroxybutyrate) depolymerase
MASLFEHTARTYKKPCYSIPEVKFRGETLSVKEKIVDARSFCNLIHFSRTAKNESIADRLKDDPKVLIVAPMSGHFATILRGTVESMLPSHDVYITDWIDAKMVPLSEGFFDLEDQIEYVMALMEKLGPDLHVLTIAQASLTCLCATALLAAKDSDKQPYSLTMIGGPIDTRNRNGVLSEFARSRPLSWLRQKQIQLVPFYYPGALRMVYPGLGQLRHRMALTINPQAQEQYKYFEHLVRGDEESKENHKIFYEEFLSVMDVPEEFYIQLMERAYQRCDLPNGSFTWRGEKVDLEAIHKTALMAIEGELDDLSPAGQTKAALDLCVNLPGNKKKAHLEISVGHYGVFNGRRWRNNIQPKIHHFIREHALGHSSS